MLPMPYLGEARWYGTVRNGGHTVGVRRMAGQGLNYVIYLTILAKPTHTQTPRLVYPGNMGMYVCVPLHSCQVRSPSTSR